MNIYSPEGIKEILRSNNLFLSKSRGQNYLSDEKIAIKIANSIKLYTKDPEKTNIIEVGSGIGSLTLQLCRNFNKVITFEIDKGIFSCLVRVLEENKVTNAIPIHEDFLKANLNEIEKLLNSGSEETIFVSNLPYSVGGEILKRVIYEMKYISKVFVMVQKEFFERLTTTPGAENYSYLSVIYQLDTKKIQKLLDIPKNHFFPTPSVDSVFIYIEKSETLTSEDERRIIKSLFSMRRKTISKSMKLNFNELKSEEIEEILKALGISPEERIENLPPQKIISLAREIKKHIQCFK